MKEENKQIETYSNKRIDLAGPLLLELYRELWGNFKRQASRKIDDEYKLNYESDDVSRLSLIINEMNVNKNLSKHCNEHNCKIIWRKVWNWFISQRRCCQDLNENVIFRTSLKRLLTPLPTSSKAIGRKLLLSNLDLF